MWNSITQYFLFNNLRMLTNYMYTCFQQAQLYDRYNKCFTLFSFVSLLEVRRQTSEQHHRHQNMAGIQYKYLSV